MKKTNGGNPMTLVKNRISICNYACVILLIALICVQLFVPFYSYTYKEEAMDVSLGDYIWFPNKTENKALTTIFTSKDVFGDKDVIESFGEKFKIDEIAFPHLYMLLLAGFGIVFCLLKNYSFVPSLFGLAAGIISIVNFSSNRGLVMADLYAEKVVANQMVCTICIVLGAVLVVNALFSMFGGLIAKLLAKKSA